MKPPKHPRLRHTVDQTYALVKFAPQKTPWAWMFVCAVSATAPLVVGWVRGENALAIFGSLSGYLMALNDQGGRRRDRIWIAALSVFAFYAGLDLGLRLQSDLPILLAVVGALTYGLGLFGGKGGEIERLLLFTIVQLVVARYAVNLGTDALPALRLYILTAWLALLGCIWVLSFFALGERAPIVGVRSALAVLATRHLARHAFAAVYALALVGAVVYVEFFRIERGYWTIITVLLVMRPDRTESYRRIAQRLVGTVTGVMTGEALIHLGLTPPVLLAAVFACTGLVPYVWQRNYWLVTFLATNFVILLLTFAVPGHVYGAITFVRLIATLHGLGITCASLLVAHAAEKIFARRVDAR